MQDSWRSKKADEIQSFADRKDMKKFFDALKTSYGPRAQEPPHSLVLMVSSIGYHQSMIKLSTDYHRWIVIDEFQTVS